MKTHHWTESDDAAALYIHKFGHQGIAMPPSALAESLGISPGSFRMRVQNFQAIDAGGGLSNFAKQSARVYELYKNATEQDLRRVVLSAISAATSGRK